MKYKCRICYKIFNRDTVATVKCLGYNYPLCDEHGKFCAEDSHTNEPITETTIFEGSYETYTEPV